ncbi:MAG: arylamine N-acetyltransferase [candidate division Zixibacteria bacterium]|nr:arylamine N-acetyltransferase [candidate division Zixibacteria bacterium]
MSHDNPGTDLFKRYLGLLGVSVRKPGPEALAELITAHLTRVPFENISKLYCRKRDNLRYLPDLDKYLDGIEHFNFGGTCYSSNYHLYLLLEYLGYEIKLCGADMTNPDVHLVSMVKLDGREYLVDIGYAAPFLKPLPRDLTEDYIIELGNTRYILKPQDNQGRSRLELYRDGQLKHTYIANPKPRQIEHFADIITQSYSDEATFMNSLLLIRFFPNRSLAIHNLNLVESQGTKAKITPIADRTELIKAIEKHFGIPANIAAEAIAQLGELQDAWS